LLVQRLGLLRRGRLGFLKRGRHCGLGLGTSARDLEAARASKEKADSGMAEATQAIARARSEAQAAVAAALEEAKSAAAKQSESLNQQLDVKLKAAEAQIAQARGQAMGALRQVASETAAEVVGRLTGAAPDQGRVTATVGAVMTSRGV